MVLTVVPSTSGSRSRCTPCRETSAPAASERAAILSISSRKTMPLFSTLASARVFSSSSLTSFAASSSTSSLKASRTRSLRVRRRPWPALANIDWICCVSSSIPGGAITSICGAGWARSISISVSSSRPSRSFLRNFCRAVGFARLLHGDVDQVADDRVDVAADVADLGELGRLDLDERGLGQAGQAARDLGLADAGGPDHQDVLRRDLAAQGLLDVLAPPAVAQRDGDGALGAVLADDVLVQLVDDFAGGHHGVFRPSRTRPCGSHVRSGRVRSGARPSGGRAGARKARATKRTGAHRQSIDSMVCDWLV